MGVPVVGYLRQSNASQENSLERQREQVRNYCNLRSYDIINWYVDSAQNGQDDSRPEFVKMLAAARRREFRHVVTDEASRLYRGTALDFLALVAHPLTVAGVTLDTVARGPVDFTELAGFITASMSQFQSRDEVVTLSRRVTTGMAQRAQAGVGTGGRCPYGYVAAPKGQCPPIVPHPDTSRIVQEAFTTYADGTLKLRGIADALNAKGVPTPSGKGKWGPNTVRYILASEIYLGRGVFNKVAGGRYHRLAMDSGPMAVPRPPEPGGKKPRLTPNAPSDVIVHEDRHAALVGRTLFERVKVMLAENQTRCGRVRTGGRHVFSHLVYCGACGRKMVGDSSGKKLSYVCSDKRSHRKDACTTRRVSEEQLVGVMWTVVDRYAGVPAKIAAIQAAAVEKARDASPKEAVVATLRARLAAATAAETKAQGAYLDCPASQRPALAVRMAERTAEREAAAAALSRATAAAEAASRAATDWADRVEGLVFQLHNTKFTPHPDRVQGLVFQLHAEGIEDRREGRANPRPMMSLHPENARPVLQQLIRRMTVHHMPNPKGSHPAHIVESVTVTFGDGVEFTEKELAGEYRASMFPPRTD